MEVHLFLKLFFFSYLFPVFNCYLAFGILDWPYVEISVDAVCFRYVANCVERGGEGFP